jgi:hypothetical protein
VKLVARAHQSLIWDRTRQVLRLRSTLRDFFPAALQAFDDLTAGEALELRDRAPDPDRPPGCPGSPSSRHCGGQAGVTSTAEPPRSSRR